MYVHSKIKIPSSKLLKFLDNLSDIKWRNYISPFCPVLSNFQRFATPAPSVSRFMSIISLESPRYLDPKCRFIFRKSCRIGRRRLQAMQPNNRLWASLIPTKAAKRITTELYEISLQNSKLTFKEMPFIEWILSIGYLYFIFNRGRSIGRMRLRLGNSGNKNMPSGKLNMGSR
jgi:hypothetical protein